ncbi:DUF4153 domain-containing protein [Falsiphaeobacter marinintestinus]|uniref:DUF4153 domain-containing protein n=1 Tax=Falsiphaeobacter marinintestinus TaxID=1492905 RepID=UPI0011B385AA|nr:DUF4153 domain-containing protein [Phaeobacter marinintestinus]
MTRQPMHLVKDRIILSVLGGGAAWALWALGQNWDQTTVPPAAYLALVSFVATWCGVGLALAGPVPLARAVLGALLLAGPVTGLISVAALRMEVATDLLDHPPTIAIASILVLFATPFLSVWLCNRRNLLEYSALFETAWTIALRYCVAWLFVGLFWILAFLSDRLLQLVDVTIIEDLIRTDGVAYALSGAILGLALSVVYELRDTISPFLVLRLLRLLVPAVLVVVGIFLIALPFRGLSHLFGEFSAGATLMSAAIVAITLVSTALDRDDTQAVATPGLRMATRALAAIVPLLAGLAVWAVWVRVGTYGWTPDRLVAMGVAVFLAAYAVGYAGSVLSTSQWGARIRQVNVVMAIVVIAGCVVWMTPVLNAFRISTTSQVARYLDGRSVLDELPLWAMAHSWGRAGEAGLEQLEAVAREEGRGELARRIEFARVSPNTFRFENALGLDSQGDAVTELVRLMPVPPGMDALTAKDFAEVPPYWTDRWLAGCHIPLPDGRPGCVWVRGTFAPTPDTTGQGMIFYLENRSTAHVSHLMHRGEAAPTIREVFDPVGYVWPVPGPDALQQVQDGAFSIGPSGQNALFLDGMTLTPAQ